MLSKKFELELQKFDIPMSISKIAIAVSGGADSTALALLLKHSKRKFDITAITINHNLRPESKKEAEIVDTQMKSLGITHKTLEWKHQGIKSNIQKQARSARQKLLTDYCKSKGIEYLFVAHNKNDVAETFLMNMLRGSGVYGLSSIANKTIYNDINILRPLLSTHKNELKHFLKSQNLTWIEDPSNQNSDFLRTKIRSLMNSKEMKDIIDDPNMLVDRITLNANNLSRAREALHEIHNNTIEKISTLHKEGYISISLKPFTTLSEEIGLKILASCLTTVSGIQEYTPRMEPLKKLHDNISSTKIQTLWGCEIVSKNNTIYIYRELGKNKPSLQQLSNSEWLWDGRLKITAKTNDTIKSLEPLKPELLNKIQEIHSKKIPKRIWKTLPLITTYDTKVYVPFLNDGDSENFSVKFLPLVSLKKTSFFHCE